MINNKNLYKQLFEQSPNSTALIELHTGRLLELNQSFLEITEYSEKELLTLTLWDIISIEEKEEYRNQNQLLKQKDFFYQKDIFLIKKDKKRIPIKIDSLSLEEESLLWIQVEDISEIKEHQTISNDNKILLEYIAIEKSLNKILNKIVSLAESRNSESKCSILLLDESKKRLLCSTAPSLPQFYNDAIHGIEIGEKIGSCGSAAFKKERVIVENINTHENWQAYLELTNKANLHSCWSQPIISSDNEIIGTFAIYNNKPKAPSGFEIKLIESYANIASKAIEKDTYTKTLDENNLKLEELFHNTQSGLLYLSEDRRLIKANKKSADIFGYENPEEMIGMSMESIHLSKERFDEFGEKNFYTLRNKVNFNIEYELKRKDNTPIWCELSGKALDKNYPADLSKGILWTINDISLRKLYQEKLFNNQILTKNILSTIPQLVWLKDEKGKYLSCNNEFEKVFGIKEKNIIGKTDYDFIDKEFADFFKEKDRNAMNSDQILINEEYVISEFTGEKILLETSKKAMKDSKNNLIGVLGVGYDITKRNQRENELKELNSLAQSLTKSQQVLLSLFDKGDSVLFNWKNDGQWNVEYVSLSVKKLFGYEKEDFLSGKVAYSSCIHRKDTKKVFEEVSDAARDNLDYFKHDPYRIITKNGEEKWVLDYTVTQKDENGKITSFIGYITDISEQIKNQELVFHQSKIASMGEMLGNISHQWRQPLSAISTLATGTRLKKELSILEDAELFEYMDSINYNAQYLSKTIDDFRNFFTSDENLVKEANLENALNTVLSLVKDSFKSSNVNTIFNTQETYTIYNENILVQAILNIFNNARDAFNENKDLKIAKKCLFLDSIKEDDYYLITIKDNAGGIPKDVINKIFEPYFTTKHKSQGTGIGLYMTNQIITKQLKGFISVENTKYIYEDVEYKGACFKIKIPI